MREIILSRKRLYLVMYMEGMREVAGSKEPVKKEKGGSETSKREKERS